MNGNEIGSLPSERQIALSYTPQAERAALYALFALDLRLGRTIGQASEPALAQLRLAWWRDNLRKSVETRPSGDRLLETLSESWPGEEEALIALIDGWEELLAEPPLPERAIRAFSAGRVAALMAFARKAGADANLDGVEQAARCWALADGAAHVSSEEERESFVRLARESGLSPYTLPRRLRGLAVLAALARRALKRGGRPLMEGRGASLAALRAGLIGR